MVTADLDLSLLSVRITGVSNGLTATVNVKPVFLHKYLFLVLTLHKLSQMLGHDSQFKKLSGRHSGAFL